MAKTHYIPLAPRWSRSQNTFLLQGEYKNEINRIFWKFPKTISPTLWDPEKGLSVTSCDDFCRSGNSAMSWGGSAFCFSTWMTLMRPVSSPVRNFMTSYGAPKAKKEWECPGMPLRQQQVASPLKCVKKSSCLTTQQQPFPSHVLV